MAMGSVPLLIIAFFAVAAWSVRFVQSSIYSYHEYLKTGDLYYRFIIIISILGAILAGSAAIWCIASFVMIIFGTT